MKGKISEMFENEAIFDKFNLCSSPDGSTILTGNYNNTFHLLDVDPSAHTQYELNYKKTTVSKQVLPGKMPPLQKMDYARKTVACDFHPKRNVAAVASLNCFYIYGMWCCIFTILPIIYSILIKIKVKITNHFDSSGADSTIINLSPFSEGDSLHLSFFSSY